MVHHSYVYQLFSSTYLFTQIALLGSFRVETDNNIACIMLLILYCLIEY